MSNRDNRANRWHLFKTGSGKLHVGLCPVVFGKRVPDVALTYCELLEAHAAGKVCRRCL